MPRIRIKRIPKGQAPYHMREALMGTKPVLSKDQKDPERYTVDLNDGIAALREKNPQAAEWWQHHMMSLNLPCFTFARGICEPLEEEAELSEEEPVPARRPVPAMTARNWGP